MVLRVDDAAFLKLELRSLPSRVRSPTPPNTDTPPCFMAIVDELHDTVLPTPAPPKSLIFRPAVRLEQVDDLDAGFEHFSSVDCSSSVGALR
jgi:hypothetical protein